MLLRLGPYHGRGVASPAAQALEERPECREESRLTVPAPRDSLLRWHEQARGGLRFAGAAGIVTHAEAWGRTTFETKRGLHVRRQEE